jgi:hypothetical protein
MPTPAPAGARAEGAEDADGADVDGGADETLASMGAIAGESMLDDDALAQSSSSFVAPASASASSSSASQSAQPARRSQRVATSAAQSAQPSRRRSVGHVTTPDGFLFSMAK